MSAPLAAGPGANLPGIKPVEPLPVPEHQPEPPAPEPPKSEFSFMVNFGDTHETVHDQAAAAALLETWLGSVKSGGHFSVVAVKIP